MTGRNRIIAFGSDAADQPPDGTESGEQAVLAQSIDGDASAVEAEGTGGKLRRSWIGVFALAAALTVVLAWTTFFIWANRHAWQAGLNPAAWTGLIASWAMPTALVALGWLLFMRHSTREARRFSDAARLLEEESARLEARLLKVNQELSLAREFIAAQSRDLETLGRLAVERLSQNAARLQELVSDNGERVQSLGAVSEAALENMEKLRGQLPVIASSAKDVTNNIANAGRIAHAQIEEMIGGFRRLNEFGQACSREVRSLREVTAEAIAEFQAHYDLMERTLAARFAAIAEQGAEFRTQLEVHEVEALAAIRSRASALREELAAARQLLESEEEDRLATLKCRLMALGEEGHAISQALFESERRALEDWKSHLAAFDADRIALFAAMEQSMQAMAEAAQSRLRAVEDDARRIEEHLAESSHTFAQWLEQLRKQAEDGNRQWLDALSQQLSSLASEIAERARGLGEELERQHAALQARHEELIATLAEKGAALDAEVIERAEAILNRIAESQAEVGESHGRLLAELSRSFEAIEDLAAERSAWVASEIEKRRSEFAAHEEQAAQRLRDQLAMIDRAITDQLAGHERHSAALAQRADRVTAELAEHKERLAAIAEQGEGIQARISESLRSITGGVLEAQSLIADTDRQIVKLTDTSVRLLELIQASAASSTKALPEALKLAEQRLKALEDMISRVRDKLEQAGGASEVIRDRLHASGEALNDLLARSESFSIALDRQSAEQAQSFADLLQSLDEMESKSQQLARKVEAELSQALAELSRSAHEAVSAFSETGAAGVSEIAARLGAESSEAIERAIRTAAAEASGRLEQAAAHAAGVSREATIQLRDQLAKVNELVANLEQRVSQARARAEEQVDNDFARRAALITESLNSNAIDIAKALSTEVSDTAWASYLRGDRGIFTRRAVRLIEAAEARAIQQIYERDRDFREHVSRYIHDFEAILRQILSTRDGHALGVTLLSSDMGKLYVALAQGIERLRD